MKHLSVVLATYNEEKNLDECLQSVKDIADEIIIVDGKSTDQTVQIAKKFGAKIISTTNKQNFHINKQMAIDAATQDWILQLDADERVTPALKKEILSVIESKDALNGYWIPRKNFFLGRYLMKGGVYPDYTLRLYQRGKGRLPQKDVHEQAVVEGEVGYLNHPLDHIADPTFERYYKRWQRYTTFIAGQYNDKHIRKDPFTMIKYLAFLPVYWFLLTYIRHKGFLDGWQGFVFSFFSSLRFPVAYIKTWRNSSLGLVVFLILILIPFCLATIQIYYGNIPFWYDPARDFLLAWGNLSKPTLIGPTSGIPGLFYGPFWIWLISIGLFVSKDPRVVVELIQVLPYFIVFPFILFQFKKIFDLTICIILWTLFIFMYGMNYAMMPWNPHLAPLLLLLFIFLLTFVQTRPLVKYFAAGIVLGLLINIDISLGMGILAGTLIYIVVYFLFFLWKKSFQDKIQHFFNSILLGCGLLSTFIPFFLFESRHGWHQVQTVIHVFTAHGAVVAQHGLTKSQILQSFLASAIMLIGLPFFISIIFLLVGVICCILYVRHRNISYPEKNLTILLLTLLTGLVCTYLLYRDPVWGYHFIGVEIIFLLLLGIVMRMNKLLKFTLLIWVIVFLLTHIISLSVGAVANPLTAPSLAEEENIVKTIQQNAGNTNYVVYEYSPSIYMYEYSYLFKWLAQKDVPYDPSQNPMDSNVVYVIMPHLSQNQQSGYINYRTPDKSYKTVNQWNMPDGSLIIKRERI